MHGQTLIRFSKHVKTNGLNHKDTLTLTIMVKLIVVTIEAFKTFVTMVTSKRSNHRDTGNLGNEAHRDNPETTFKIKSSCKLCAVFFRF